LTSGVQKMLLLILTTVSGGVCPRKVKETGLFITHMIETTYEGSGKVGVVVPHGVLFRGSSEGNIRQKTIEENLLEAVIGLPANLFFGTGIPAAILIFNKGKGENSNVLFIDASERYEQGKNQNVLQEKGYRGCGFDLSGFQSG
jgi:type I restriction enzyme M protein